MVNAAVLGSAEAGRDPHQHRARRGRRLPGAGGRRARQAAPRRPRRLRQRAGIGRARLSRRSDRACPACYGTHHIGASTDQAQEAIAAETVRIIRSFKETGRVPNVVNLATRTPATHMLVVRHRDRPGVLAHVFDNLRAGQPQRPGDREHRLRRGARPPSPASTSMARRHRRCATVSRRRTPTFSILQVVAALAEATQRSQTIMTTTTRIFNFSAGPAVLPVEVLEQAQRDLLSLPGVGMSILEISHRSKPFDEIIQGCEADLRTLAGIPDGYHVLFLQGGASLQFSMVPMNLLPAQGSADYIVTGAWSQKAVKEAKRVGRREDRGVDRRRELRARAEAGRADARSARRLRALHDEQHDLRHRVPLRAGRRQRAARRRHVVRHLQPADRRRRSSRSIYAGAQKNLAPAGRDAGHHPRRHAQAHAVDRCRRCCSTACTSRTSRCTTRRRCSRSTSCGWCSTWLLKQGGLAAIEKRNARKADKLYAEIDRTGFYRGHAHEGQPVADERDVPPAQRGAREDSSPRRRPRPASTA